MFPMMEQITVDGRFRRMLMIERYRNQDLNKIYEDYDRLTPPSLYIHIPFCRSKCIYCDFYSTTGLTVQEEYVDALLMELEMHKQFRRFSTIYIGGGTPSVLEIKQLVDIISTERFISCIFILATPVAFA